MSFIFLPSLQHLAAVKVALAVYYDDIIQLSGESILSDEVCRTTYKESWIMIQKIASVKLSKLLPESLQKQVVQLIQPMSSEAQIWITNHSVIKKHVKKDFANNLCWKPEGTIDRIKTAKQFIQNKKIDTRVRFVIACIYFLESEILTLWREMSAFRRMSIPRIDTNIVVRFWMKRLKKRDISPWTQAIGEYLETEFEYRDTDSPFRLSSFYIALDRETRWTYISQLWPWITHVDDLLYCIYQMDVTERHETLRRMPTKVLHCYLRWPLQSLFLDIADSMRSRLSASCLKTVLHNIEKKNIMQGIQDFDYLKLHKDFSDLIPDIQNELIKK
ncbi:hypothetical protein AVEN_142565-1 [Araneus ventricosus]|uniref:SOCS box domain-containing protein n=1 Tax=Araneus ventricosus TaxID=182803 RepID=A0A4Y2CGE6_ARAVE|nr:hypothetical protein AVEN_142565-1 [Araneus ventricosus]